MLFKNSKQKIFCIGLNKTGTTSLGLFFEKAGFNVAKQHEGELLLRSYINRDFKEITKYVTKSKYSVFQDVPFSLPLTFLLASITLFRDTGALRAAFNITRVLAHLNCFP